jgi:hypothetical protein
MRLRSALSVLVVLALAVLMATAGDRSDAIVAGTLLAIALALAIYWFRASRSWVEADRHGLRTSRLLTRRSIGWSEIEDLGLRVGRAVAYVQVTPIKGRRFNLPFPRAFGSFDLEELGREVARLRAIEPRGAREPLG